MVQVGDCVQHHVTHRKLRFGEQPRNGSVARLLLALFGHQSDDDGGLLLGAKRTCRLSFHQASELPVPLDRELLQEIVELEVGRLPAFEDRFNKGR